MAATKIFKLTSVKYYILPNCQIAKFATVASVWNKILLPILAENNTFFSKETWIKVREIGPSA